ncbi:MAG: glycosyl hydrolase, partial [bacterium]|nr:glycosyl hydrolase [bacterium]
DDRGDSWRAMSGDLTRDQERLALPIMGQTQSWDNACDLAAMSTYNTITSLAESPLQEGLIYAGTDDGLIQVTEDGGGSWREIEVGSLPGTPGTAFVNDIKADLFDADTVYAALDNHKLGELGPHLLRSRDRGRTWTSMRGNLPERTLVWRLVQDHVRPELFFAATELGIYFTVDGGELWIQLKGGVPTISFRDLAIQRRENDLVAASFGRGFFILDDYSALREISTEQLGKEAVLFPTRQAWWYFPRPHLSFEPGRGDQGADHFVAPNPPFGSVFTYYLEEDLKTRKEARQETEKAAREKGEAVIFPGWDALEAERIEPEARVWLVVTDSEGEIVRRISGPTDAGFHRVAWDLRYPTPDAVELEEPPPPLWGGPPRGLMVAPGEYQVALVRQVQGEARLLAGPRSFTVAALRQGSLDGASPEEVAGFWRQYESAVRTHSAIRVSLERMVTKVGRLAKVIESSRGDVLALDPRFHQLRRRILELDGRFGGHRSKQEPGEKHQPTIGQRLESVALGVDHSTYGPTVTHLESLKIATAEMAGLRQQLESTQSDLSSLVRELIEAGAPWIESEPLSALP